MKKPDIIQHELHVDFEGQIGFHEVHYLCIIVQYFLVCAFIEMIIIAYIVVLMMIREACPTIFKIIV